MIKYLWSKFAKKVRLASIRNSLIHKTAAVEAGSSLYCSTMGKYSFCGYDCEIYYSLIGNYCSIANNVTIGGARHPMEWIGMSPVFYAGRDSVKKKFSEFELDDIRTTNIGNDVWIGKSAIVLSGVTIGNGAVVGAGSVVTKDVAPYAIVAGNPAKVIRYRFSEEIREGLEKCNWWDLDDQRLQSVSHLVREPSSFIKALSGKSDSK
ncbi:CatB-related O-acetyltransferase [Chitinibacter tainanensis]|uniref:CatB-related O-acetyltransferase n=1 Tax=Chitinibacter tainanensis TaxID=230667 RepID=UPI0035716074